MDDHSELPEFPEFSDFSDYAAPPPERPRYPWLTMWVRPRATIRGILDADPTYGVILLASLSGVFDVLNRASQRDMGDVIAFEAILLGDVTLGPLAGIAGVYIAGWLLQLTGRWLGGQGDAQAVRAAAAWGGIPVLWISLLWIPQLALVREEMFTRSMPRTQENPALLTFLLVSGLTELVAAIWGLVVGLKSVGEAHRFSAWRALGASLLAGLVVLIPILLLVVVLLAAMM